MDSEFSAKGVQIKKGLRSLTRAGGVRVQDGRVVLLTSRGREIDSAPVLDARTGAGRWFGPGGDAQVALEGRRYLLRMRQQSPDGRQGLLDALRRARGSAAQRRNGGARG